MSSGFVSGGTADTPIERSDEWLAAQKDIEASRQRKIDQARQSEGKSLYETLEANKAAKQEAFEEANRLKNQFRALDEDEVEFLDSVLESTRAEEDRVKKETAEGLAQFRQQQEHADRKARKSSTGTIAEEGSPGVEDESWTASGRKRKRTKDKEGLKGVKARRPYTSESPKRRPSPTVVHSPEAMKQSVETKLVSTSPATRRTGIASATTSKIPLCLVDYGSESD